jgi:hypothetical protein
MMRFGGRRPLPLQDLLQAVTRCCRPPLRRGVRAAQADYYVKRYRSTNVALALVSYFLLGLSSLRELQRRLSYDVSLGRRVGLQGISVSQLSKVLHDRPSAFWVPLMQHLVRRVRGGQVDSVLRVIDSTFLRLSLKLASRCCHKTFQPTAPAGIQVTLVLDAEHLVPVRLKSHVGSGSDAANGRAVVPPDLPIAGHLYLFDRGFRSYAFYQDLLDRDADFVTRQSALCHYERLADLPLDPEHPAVLSDQKVRLGSANGHNRMTRPVRRIVLQTAAGDVIFLTSCFDLSAFEITELYRQRWIIEVFFRWLKRVIGCQKPLAYSQQAAEHTVYAALVAYLLTLLLAPAGLRPTHHASTFRLKEAFGLLRAWLYQPPRPLQLHALGFD